MKKNDWILLASVAVYSYLFYAQTYGINFLIFTIFLIVMLLIKDATVLKHKTWIAAAAGSITTAVAVTTYGNYLSFLSNIISLSLLSALSFSRNTSVLFALLFSFYSYVSSIVFMLIDYLERKKKKLQIAHPLSVRLLLFIIPAFIVLIFFLLYRSSNPLFYNFTKNINLDFISWPWLRFTFAGVLLLYGFFYHRVITVLKNADGIASNELQKERSVYKSRLGAAFTQHHENLSGIILFTLLNALLLTVNILDAIYLWGSGGLPTGMNYTDFVHQGTGTLITSIILAILIILYYFRGSINFSENNTLIKLFAYLWIAQNIFMIASTAYRNNLYIADYFLTYKRIGVFFYLLLCVIGLVTTFIKIRKIKSNWYLFRINSWLFYSVLIASAFLSWDGIITHYNIKMAEERRRPIDKNYLIDLSYINIPELIEMSDSLKNKRMEDNTSYGSSFNLKRSYYNYYGEEKDFKPRLHLKLYNFLSAHQQQQWQSYSAMKDGTIEKINREIKLHKMDSLLLSQNGLSSMEPIYPVKSLKSLDFSHNSWTNTAELKNFPFLESLDISHNPVDTITAMPVLKNLKRLNISNNKSIYPLSKIAELKTLEYLNVADMNITSAYYLPQLPNLKSLDLSGNSLVDFTPLAAKYPVLENLYINNCIRFYGFEFSIMPSLKKLEMTDNRNDLQMSYLIDKLTCFPNLTELNLRGDQVMFIPAASDSCDIAAKEQFCNSLQSLLLSGNQINNLHGISKFPNLTNLELASNNLMTLDGVQNLQHLEKLILNHNDQLVNIDALYGLEQLQSLDLANCSRVIGYDKLITLKNLTSLDLSNTGFNQLALIIDLNKLAFLDISNNEIVNVTALKNKSSLQELIISGNRINDLTPLYALKQLKRLVVIGVAPIDDLRKLKAALPHTEVITNMGDDETTDAAVTMVNN